MGNTQIRYGNIKDDPRVKESIKKLESMGFIFEVIQPNNDKIFILIDVDSVIHYIKRQIQNKLTVKHKVDYDKDKSVLILTLMR
ncbi:MAG: hypothetical protein QW512_05315 [Thermofilaceae archaeon]